MNCQISPALKVAIYMPLPGTPSTADENKQLIPTGEPCQNDFTKKKLINTIDQVTTSDFQGNAISSEKTIK